MIACSNCRQLQDRVERLEEQLDELLDRRGGDEDSSDPAS
jgi:hypothetical protein